MVFVTFAGKFQQTLVLISTQRPDLPLNRDNSPQTAMTFAEQEASYGRLADAGRYRHAASSRPFSGDAGTFTWFGASVPSVSTWHVNWDALAGLCQPSSAIPPTPTSASQRRVTFHLPDGSQESCSDSGLGDHEPVGSGPLLSHPLPLVQAQDDFYEQASPDKRTEADGNSDPNSGESAHICGANLVTLLLSLSPCLTEEEELSQRAR
ncbi:hypothetical protein QQF64_029188 [Cirrhinus molitorella]|uniref:Uncharacterized protein n=1 Tax=Cirrhinus molitorella TaxID=172907 RepID=A0ABR3N8P1_9TELE